MNPYDYAGGAAYEEPAGEDRLSADLTVVCEPRLRGPTWPESYGTPAVGDREWRGIWRRLGVCEASLFAARRNHGDRHRGSRANHKGCLDLDIPLSRRRGELVSRHARDPSETSEIDGPNSDIVPLPRRTERRRHLHSRRAWANGSVLSRLSWEGCYDTLLFGAATQEQPTACRRDHRDAAAEPLTPPGNLRAPTLSTARSARPPPSTPPRAHWARATKP